MPKNINLKKEIINAMPDNVDWKYLPSRKKIIKDESGKITGIKRSQAKWNIKIGDQQKETLTTKQVIKKFNFTF